VELRIRLWRSARANELNNLIINGFYPYFIFFRAALEFTASPDLLTASPLLVPAEPLELLEERTASLGYGFTRAEVARLTPLGRR